MTETTVQQAELDPYVPAGHPVRSFALAIVVVATLAGAVWWSGLVQPRLEVGASSAGSFNTDTLAGDVLLTVRNAGPLPVRLEEVTVDGAGYRFVGAALVAPDPDPDTFDGRSLPPFEPTELAAGERAELQIRFEADECRIDDPDMELTVRTPAGLRRSIALGDNDRMEMFCATAPPG